MPRVITGILGGRVLRAPDGRDTRPTADRTKQAIFSMLSARLDFSGIRVLDLFAGSGQLGIEALSRGADHAVFVEKNRRTARLIQDNLRSCDLTARSTVYPTTAHEAITRLAASGEPPFDLVLMDPPYAEALADWEQLLPKLIQNGLLSDGALVVLEHASDGPEPADVTDLQSIKHCKYGMAMVSFSLYHQTMEDHR